MKKNKDLSGGSPPGSRPFTAFWRGAVRSVSHTLAAGFILAAFIFAVHLLCGAASYNPARGNGVIGRDGLASQMSVAFELHQPGRQVVHASASPKGFGRYEVFVQQRDLFSGNLFLADLELTRGSVTRLDSAFRNDIHLASAEKYGGAGWVVSENFRTGLYGEAVNEYFFAELEAVPESAVISMFLCFRQPVGLAELEEICLGLPLYASIEYASVDCGGVTSDTYAPFGFRPYHDRYSESMEALNAAYPNLFFTGRATYSGEKVWTEHFISMLNYLAEDEDFNRMAGFSDAGTYRALAAHFSDNDIAVNGVLVYARRDDAVQLIRDLDPYCVWIEQMKLSPLY